MVKEVKLSSDKYYKGVLVVLDCFLKLNKAEMSYLDYIAANGIRNLTHDTRANMRIALNKDKYSYNNVISSLRKKGVLVGARFSVKLNPSIADALDGDEFILKIKKL